MKYSIVFSFLSLCGSLVAAVPVTSSPDISSSSTSTAIMTSSIVSTTQAPLTSTTTISTTRSIFTPTGAFLNLPTPYTWDAMKNSKNQDQTIIQCITPNSINSNSTRVWTANGIHAQLKEACTALWIDPNNPGYFFSFDVPVGTTHKNYYSLQWWGQNDDLDATETERKWASSLCQRMLGDVLANCHVGDPEQVTFGGCAYTPNWTLQACIYPVIKLFNA